VNLDGYLDLYVGLEDDPCQLWLNQGNGTFVDMAEAYGVSACGWPNAVTFGYANDDMYPDLFISTFGNANYLYMNNGDGTFTDQASYAGVGAKPQRTFPAYFADIDNDGDEDLFVTTHRSPNVGEMYASYTGTDWEEQHLMTERGIQDTSGTPILYQNQGDGTFKDVSEQYGLGQFVDSGGAMGMNCGDIDNDGYLDTYIGSGDPQGDARLMANRMARLVDGEYYEDVTIPTGTGHLHNGHGISFADVNNDGLQDMLASYGGVSMPKTADGLYVNPGGSGYNYSWVKVSLTGVKSNRLGTGAKLQVFDKTTGRSIYMRQGISASFGDSSKVIQHIGLGNATSVVDITVQWPHSSLPVDTYEDVSVNSWVHLTEGKPKDVTYKELKTVPIQKLKDAQADGTLFA